MDDGKYIYEGMIARMERVNHKLVAVLIIAIALMFLSNLAWLYVWEQYDYVVEDSSVTVDSDNGIANYIGENGDINYGMYQSHKSEEETD